MATPSVIIDFEPNWDSEPELSYGFLTAIQGTPYFKEQRRPMVPTLSRIQSCKFTFIDEAMQRARNVLLYGAPRLCYVPIYSEPIQAAAVTQGASAITASTDITYYWNLQNCGYAVILDFLTGQSEAVAVASVAGQVINLTGAIVQVWDAATCVIYPAFPGKISAVKESAVTSRLLELDAQFEEVTIGEEATKVWVGLDVQVCPEDTPMTDSCSEYFIYDDGVFPENKFALFNQTPDSTATPQILNNKLLFFTDPPYSAGYKRAQYRTVYEFLGEYDFSICFDIASVGATSNFNWLFASVGSDNGYYGGTFHFKLGETYYYDCNFDDPPYSDSVNTTDTSGKFRFRRDASNDIYLYVWNSSSSQWEWNGSTSGKLLGNDTGNTYLGFETYLEESNQINIYDFIVTAGCDNTQPIPS